MTRPQHEINAEIELHRPEREARVRRMQLTAAVCEEVAKRMMEGTQMTSSGVIAAVGMREAAAKAIDHCLCDVAEDSELFLELRDYFAATVRATPLPEWTPDPREPKGCPTPGACSCIEPDPSLKAAWEAVRVRDADINVSVKKRDATIARLAAENETLVSGMTQLAERAVASSTVALAEIDRLRTFIRSARGIVQHFASANPKHIWGGHEQDPLGAHGWLAAESAEVGTNRDGGDPKVEGAGV